MKQERAGVLKWKNAKIEWRFENFKNMTDLEIQPHFVIKATDEKTNEWIEWPNVTIDTDELANSLKGITDFTKLPLELQHGILDNCVAKLNEPLPAVTRIEPHGKKN